MKAIENESTTKELRGKIQLKELGCEYFNFKILITAICFKTRELCFEKQFYN
jgi:hypothetical protein